MRERIIYISVLISLFFSSVVLANGGYDIRVNVSNYDGEEAYLAYYLGPGQYILDTSNYLNGSFRFRGENELASGFYLVVFPPRNYYFHLLLNESEQVIEVTVDGGDLQRPKEIKGSADTRLFYDYAEFLSERRPEADRLRVKTESAKGQEKADLEKQLEALNSGVTRKQDQIIARHPESLTAMMIKAHREFDEPQFSGTEEEIQQQTYQYYRDHYFDNIALSDPRIVRTPFIHERISHYVDKLTYQQVDSINKTLDYILGHFDPDGEAFQVYLVYFLNEYAKSKIVGMDAVYVHLVENYYAKGLASWTDPEQLNKIVDNAEKIKPILIGKKSPNLSMKDRNGKEWVLHDVPARFTVLFFWDPECGHCKTSIPFLKEFYENYKSKGVEIYSVCTKLGEGVPKCWEAVDERGMGQWINVADAYLRTRYKQIYDVKTTPQIYVLDADKNIVMKKIGAEQLPNVMDRFLEDQTLKQ